MSADDVWAVGGSTIAHWNGRTWSSVAAPALAGLDLKDVEAIASDDVWAVGSVAETPAGVALHWNGVLWTRVELPFTSSETEGFDAVSASGRDDVWVAGNSKPESMGSAPVDGSGIANWDGSAWTLHLTPMGAVDIVALAPNDVWASYNDGSRTSSWGQTIHWNGSEWVQKRSWSSDGTEGESYTSGRAVALSAAGPDSVWGGGALPRGPFFSGLVVPLRGSGGETGTPVGLASLEARLPTDVWASGGDGHVLRWDGIRWQWVETATPLDRPFTAMAAVAADDVWAIQENGKIQHFAPRCAPVATERPKIRIQAKPGTLRAVSDKFDDGSLSGWTISASGAVVSERDGRLEVTPPVTTRGFGEILSGVTDGRGDYATVELVSAGSQSVAALTSWFQLQDAGTASNVALKVGQGVLRASKRIGGAETVLASVPYDAQAVRWLRLREAFGRTYWEYSADRVEWRTLHAETDPFAMNAVRLQIGAGKSAAAGNAGTVAFDNVSPSRYGNGDTLSSTTGSWESASALQFEYYWFLCARSIETDASRDSFRPYQTLHGNCVANIGNPSVERTAALEIDASGYYDGVSLPELTARVAVTAASGSNRDWVFSEPFTLDLQVPTPREEILLAGNAVEGSKLYPAGSEDSPYDEVIGAQWTNAMAVSFTWYRCGPDGTGCKFVAGASFEHYDLGAADVGKRIFARLTGQNHANSAAYDTPLTAVITGAPTNASPPVVSGDPVEARTLTVSRGTWNGSPTGYAYQWQRCDVAGDNCAPISGATSSTYLLGASDVDKTLRGTVTASNADGSAAATSANTPVIRPVRPAVTAPTAAFAAVTNVQVAWAPGSPAAIASYDVRYREGTTTAAFGAYTSWKNVVPVRSAWFAGSPGSTYCFSARARTSAGTVSDWSGERCTAVPLDDRALTTSGTWTRVTNSAYYLSTYTRTTSFNVSLKILNLQARRLALVATRCPSCGIVNVFWNGSLLKQINLYAASTLRKQIIDVGTFANVQTGTVEVRVVSSGKAVEIDGLGASRT